MESYGEILKKAREAKNIDRETVSRETSIALSYITGLEDEDDSAFPGEAYMLGFMRNYSEYIGVNPESVLTLYKNKKLQEAPVPKNLYIQEKPGYFWPLFFSGIGLFVVAVFIVLFLFITKKKAAITEDVVLDKDNISKKYELTDKALTTRLYKGDQIIFPGAEGQIVLTVSNTLSEFGLQCPVGTLYTELAEEAELDIDGDSNTDLIVYVSDISAANEARGAEVRLLKRGEGAFISAVSASDIPFATEIDSAHKQQVIFEDNRAYPFTINGSFRGACEFRYKIDRRDAVEAYFTSGEVATITANNGVRLWMSNCNTVKFSIVADARTYDLEIGKAGQVLAEDIKWIKDTDGKYKLVVIELD